MTRKPFEESHQPTINEPRSYVSRSFQEIYLSVLEDIMKYGEHTGDTKELRNITLHLTNPRDRMIWINERNPNYTFAMQFFIWMWNGGDDIEPLLALNKNAIRYANPETGKLSTAYGPRIKAQISEVLKELITRGSTTRRAVISILWPEDNKMLSHKRAGTENQEYPCTDHFVFHVTNPRTKFDNTHGIRTQVSKGRLKESAYLNMTTVMRSNNMLDTVIYDVFAFTMIQEMIVNMMNHEISLLNMQAGEGDSLTHIRMGSYTHMIHSAHVYHRDFEKVDKVLTNYSIGLPLIFKGNEENPNETKVNKPV